MVTFFQSRYHFYCYNSLTPLRFLIKRRIKNVLLQRRTPFIYPLKVVNYNENKYYLKSKRISFLYEKSLSLIERGRFFNRKRASLCIKERLSL